jgi:hypothetical protein
VTAGRLSAAEYRAVLRQDFAAFAERVFYEIDGRGDFAANWNIEVVAAKLAAVRADRPKPQPPSRQAAAWRCGPWRGW